MIFILFCDIGDVIESNAEASRNAKSTSDDDPAHYWVFEAFLRVRGS